MSPPNLPLPLPPPLKEHIERQPLLFLPRHAVCYIVECLEVSSLPKS